MWIILNGGYKRLRELSGKEADRATLRWTGSMMRALEVVNIDAANYSVTIGFTNDEAGQLAGYHHSGVGKSRKKRIFMGLSEQELQRVAGSAKLKF